VHQRRQPRVIVLDMDSSESPTYGEQEGSGYNGHSKPQLPEPTGEGVVLRQPEDHRSARGRLWSGACRAVAPASTRLMVPRWEAADNESCAESGHRGDRLFPRRRNFARAWLRPVAFLPSWWEKPIEIS
jgi:hypothetical protein